MIILVEGIDGSGKTYFIEQIMQALSIKGINVKLYSENSIPEIKTIISQLLNSKMYNPYTHLFLSVASYHILQQEILKEHNSGTVILWDRYIPSTVVYSKVLGVDEQTIQTCISKLNTSADMSIFCDVTPDVAFERKKFINNLESGLKGENNFSAFIDFQTRVYNEYWKLINESNNSWYIYNGTSVEMEQILQIIIKYQNKENM